MLSLGLLLLTSSSTRAYDKVCLHGDEFCQRVNDDSSSYCKFNLDEPVCQGGDQPCTCIHEPCQDGDQFCKFVNDDVTSRCDQGIHPHICKGVQGGGQVCECLPTEPCVVGDEFCKSENQDTSSFCKYWLEPSVCYGGDQPCSCLQVSATFIPQSLSSVTDCVRADELCDELLDFQGGFCNLAYGRCSLGEAVSPYPCNCSSECPRADVFCRAATDMPFTPTVQYDPSSSACTSNNIVILNDVRCVPDSSNEDANASCGQGGDCQFGFTRESNDYGKGYCLRTAVECPPVSSTAPPTNIAIENRHFF